MSCSQNEYAPASFQEVAIKRIYAGALDDRGEHAIVGSAYHGISYWRLHDGERLFDWSHKNGGDTSMTTADFSPDGQWALTADQQTLVLWDTRSGAAARYWQTPSDILAVQLAPNALYALVGMNNHSAVLFDIRRGGILHTFQHNAPVRSVSMDFNGKIAATASDDYTAVTWNLETQKPLAKLRHNDQVQLVAVSPDGSLVLSVSKYDKAIIWQTQDGKVIAEIPLKAGRLKRGLSFTHARFSDDNQFLLTGQTDQTVSLWRLSDLKKQVIWRVGKRQLWKPTGASIMDIAFSATTGIYYAVLSNGHVVRLEQPSNS